MKKRINFPFVWLFTWMLIPQLAAAKNFVHPGIQFTIEDLEYMKAHKDIEPWKSSYELILASPLAALDYKMAGPFETVNREPNVNFNEYEADGKAAFYQAILYYVTGIEQYGENATKILNAWAVKHNEWGGGTVHIQDFMILEAAEIARHTYPGWTDENSANFENYARNVLLQVTHYPYTAKAANQGGLQLFLRTRVAIFLSDEEMFANSIDALLNDPCAGIGNSLPNGQNGDTGRDQAHAWMMVNFLAQSVETVFHQGVDLFSTLNDRLYHMGEYWFKYNLGYDVEWIPFGTCYGYYPTIGETARGELNTHPRLYETLYNAYVLRKGKEAPYLKEFRSSQAITAYTFLYRKEEDNSIVPENGAYLTEPWTEHSDLSTSVFTGVNLGSDKSGSSSYDNGVLTIKASAGDGYGGGSSDGGFYEYVNVLGDATIIAKINSHSSSVSNSKFGVMFRESLSATADMFAIHSTSDQMMATWRGYEGPRYTSERQYYPEVTTPVWAKIVINGNRISGYISEDKESWAPMGGKHFDGTENYYLGLFGASINASNEAIGTFSDIEVYNSVACSDYSYNSFDRIEAERFCESFKVDVNFNDTETYVTGTEQTAWIKYPNFNFTTHLPKSIDLSFASEGNWGMFSLRLDDPNSGEVIASFPVSNTGGLSTFITANAALTNITELSGTHDVYLVFGKAINIDWFEFKNSCQEEEAIDAFALIEAEDYCNMSGVEKSTAGSVEYVGNAEQGDWIYFPNVDFGGVRPNSIFLNCASSTDGKLNILLDDPFEGTVISRIDVSATGGESKFEIVSGSVTSHKNLTGKKDVYITFEKGCNIDNFYFDVSSCYSNIFYTNQLIEAEDFCEMSGVNIELLSDESRVVSDIQNGDYIHFPRIQLGTKGSNIFQLKAASATEGGNIEVRKNAPDGDLIATLEVKSTTAWDAYQEFSLEFDEFVTSYQDIYLVFTSSSNTGDLFKIDNFSFLYEKCPDLYFNARSVIQAEDYCEMYGVKIIDDYLGDLQNGDWVHYSNVDFGRTSPLSVNLNLSGMSSDGSVDVIIDNIGIGPVIASTKVEATGGWTNWKDFPMPLNQEVTGMHDVFIYFKDAGNNINSFQFSDEFVKGPTDPYQRFEAEINDDEKDVLNEITTDIDGGKNVVGIEADDYVMFSELDLSEADSIKARISSAKDGGSIEVRLGNKNGTIIAFIDVPNTGSDEWVTVSAKVDFTGEISDVYFVFKGEGSELFKLNWLQFTEFAFSFDKLRSEDNDEASGFILSGETSDAEDDVLGQMLRFLKPGNWIKFNDVDLSGAKSITARYSSIYDEGSIEVRLDAADGTLLGTITLSGTGGFSDWATAYTNLNEASGVHDVYFVFQSTRSVVCNSNWFQFSLAGAGAIMDATNRIEAENYTRAYGTSTISTTDVDGNKELESIDYGNWILFKNVDLTNMTNVDVRIASPNTGSRIELRHGAYNGTILSFISIPNTGSATTWQTVNANLYGNLNGVYDVYVVFKGSSENLLNINWLQFKGLTDGVEDIIAKPKVMVYPNPVDNMLNIDGQANSTLEIYNANGTMVYVGEIRENQFTLSTKDLNPGLHIFKILNTSTVQTGKFLKQ